MTGATTLTIPTLTTERLTMRAPLASDLAAYTAFCTSPRSVGVGGPYSEADSFHRLCSLVGHWQIRGYGRWMLADRGTDEPLGVVGLMFPVGWPEPEIAWSLFDAGEGRGLAQEAALAARAYAYDTLGWTTVISCVMPTNTRSIALAKRMGATFDYTHAHPEYGDLHVWRHPAPQEVAQ